MQHQNQALNAMALAAFIVMALPSTEPFQPAMQIAHHKSSSTMPLAPLQNVWKSRLQMTDDDAVEETGSSSEDISPTNDTSAIISDYKSNLNPRRSFAPSPRSGSTSPPQIDVTMKFGGSSLANAERVDRVANLIKTRIHPPEGEVPCRPRAVICSAMGKTTNSLLSAGEMALEGRVDLEVRIYSLLFVTKVCTCFVHLYLIYVLYVYFNYHHCNNRH
jgi:hypothetical protein